MTAPKKEKTAEEKAKHVEAQRRYREKKKAAASIPSAEVEPVTDTVPDSPPCSTKLPEMSLQEDLIFPSDEKTVFVPDPEEGGKGGTQEGEIPEDACATSVSSDTAFFAKAVKGGELSNAEFFAAIFQGLPEGASAAGCYKYGDPTVGGWGAIRSGAAEFAAFPPMANNFVNCSSFYSADDGSFKARKSHFAACHCIMLDDVGTKVPPERLAGFTPTWLIETSPGNFQAGIVFDEPITDRDTAVRLLDAVIAAGLCDAGSTGPLTRWARLAVGINGKPKYHDASGQPYKVRLAEWNPEARYSPSQVVDALQLELAPAGRPKKEPKQPRHSGNEGDDVLTPRAEENPVVAALKARDLYKTPLGSGKHDVTCPWVDEHTDKLDTGAAYFEPDEFFPVGGFCCQHSHRDKYRIRALLDFLGIRNAEARHKPVIRVVAGDLHRVVDAAEKELAARGRHYQSGGLIVSISTDPTTGDPSIVPTNAPALTRELSVAATWEKFDARAGGWVNCDPPQRHIGVLYDGQNFRHLPALAGVARQPYFLGNGELVTQSGYEPTEHRFGVFDARQFVIPEPTREAAKKALAVIEELLGEFSFVGPCDKAAALAAIFTAVVRTSLPHAPGFHVRAPVFGSGKSYLCELISAFAGPGGDSQKKGDKVSYPTTSEEATKAILALLLNGPAVIEFDDMDTDWIPHGVIKRMLTAEHITDRVLGVSKTATVSTRTLVLGSGNNVGPIRDLLRRVLTIHIDPRCATPATRVFNAEPVAKVYQNRGRYVAAVLTIILAWQKAGRPRQEWAGNIVTYSGAWSEYCRHPLMWLGHPDPATALFEQLKHDPDAEILDGLMTEWTARFDDKPTTVRELVTLAWEGTPLRDAISEFPVEERGVINRSKLGWIIKKNAGRVINGRYFEKATADGRTAWRVLAVKE